VRLHTRSPLPHSKHNSRPQPQRITRAGRVVGGRPVFVFAFMTDSTNLHVTLARHTLRIHDDFRTNFRRQLLLQMATFDSWATFENILLSLTTGPRHTRMTQPTGYSHALTTLGRFWATTLTRLTTPSARPRSPNYRTWTPKLGRTLDIAADTAPVSYTTTRGDTCQCVNSVSRSTGTRSITDYKTRTL